MDKIKNKKFVLISLLLFLLIIIIIFATNPTFTNLITSSNVLTNNTNVNLSVLITNTDATGLANITNWYENNISLAVLNMPFVTNNSDVKDYSGYNNNGTISGALWQRYLNEDNNSLVLLMPFDSDNTTTAIDSSDYKNNGVLSGGVSSTSDCPTGKCYSFDGVNDLINISDSNNWYYGSNDYSISGWIYFVRNSGYNVITNQGYGIVGGVARAHLIYYDWAGSLLHVATQNDTTSTNNQDQSFSWSASTNTWYMFTVLRSGTNLKAYINGVQIGNTLTAYDVQNSNYPLQIGTDYSNPFNGSIDNVRIYNKALTATEIQDHYNKVKLYYQPSFKFDGVNDYINISSSSFKDDHPRNAFTIEAWVNTNGKGGNQFQTIVDTSQSGISGFMLRLGGSDTKVRFDFNSAGVGGFSQAGNTNLNNNTWYHLVNTWDGTTNTNGVKYYINGVLDKQTSTTITGQINSSKDLVIGTELGLSNVFFNGSIANVRIYNRSLSANQIYELYNSYNTSGINKLVLNEITAGKTYKAQVYVANASDLGAPQNTSELLVIDDFAYFINNSVINSTLGLNRTTEDLNVFFTPRKNDTIILNYSIEVFRNNVSNFIINNIYTRNNTFTQFIIDKANISVGQTWKAQIGLKTNFTITTYANTSEILILENQTPIITLNYPIEGTQFTASAITFRYKVNDTSLINQCQLFIDNILLKTNSSIIKDIEDSYLNSTLTNGNHKWYVNCLDSQNIQANSTINNFLVDASLSSGGTTGGGAGGGSTINATQQSNQTNQTIILNQTITQPINIIQKTAQDVIQSTPKEVNVFLMDNKVYLFIISGLLTIMGMIPIIEKKKDKKYSLIILGGFIGLIAYKPEISLYLTKDLPKIIADNLKINIRTGVIVIISAVVSIIVLYNSFKKRRP